MSSPRGTPTLRPWAWLTLLVAATALVWLLVRDGVSLSEPATAPGTETRVSAAAGAAAEPGPNASVRTPVLAPDAAADGLRPVRVVATLPDGDPAAGAVVRYSVRAVEPPRHSQWSMRVVEDLEAELAGSGHAVVADDRGVAALPAAVTRLCVRSGACYAEAIRQDQQDEVRVALARDVTLRVQVRDPDGRPGQNLDVTAEVHAASRHDGQREGRWRLARTDAQGLTTWPHAQLAIPLPGPDILAWGMVLRCDFGPVVERAVTAAEIATGAPLVLQVPAGGTIAVDVEGAAGAWIWASVALEDAVDGGQRDDDRDDGVSWFRQVPLGRRWFVNVQTLGEQVRREIVGPTRHDELVRVRIPVPLREIVLRGRVVRADGLPVPGARIRFRGEAARFFHDGTDSRDGSLGDRVGDFLLHGALPTSVATVNGATLRIEREPYCLPTTIALPPLRAGTIDLGEVLVQAPAGEVLLASVEVRAGGRNVSAGAWAFLQGSDDSTANAVTSIRAVQDQRIVFRGPATTRPLVVGASCAGFLSRRVPVRAGEHIVLELELAARLTVPVRFPPVPPWFCTARLVGDRDHDATGERSGEGFQWSDLEPGRYRLSLLVDGRVVHETAALDLVRGANRWPPNGSAIDLRQSAQAHHLDIRTTHGQEVRRLKCFVLPADRGAPPDDLDASALALREPQWFVMRPQLVELVVTAAGCVPVRLPAPSGDTQVRLAPATTLRVHTAPGDGVTTIVHVVADGVHDPWLRALDAGNLHGRDAAAASDEPLEYTCVPGTVVEVAVERDGVIGPAQRVVIGPAPVAVVAR